MTSALLPANIIFRAFTQSGTFGPLAGGKLYFYVAGSSTPQAVYTDATGLVALSNPVILDANGQSQFWLKSGQNYKVNLTDSSGVQQAGWPADNIPADQGTAILAALAASTGASMIGYQSPITGSVATTVQKVLQDFVTISQFGGDPTGTTDSTAAIQAALNNGGRIIVDGVFNFSSQLVIKPNTHLEGWGWGLSVIKWTGATNVSNNMIVDQSMITNTLTTPNLSFKDMEFNFNSYNGTAPVKSLNGIIFYRTSNVLFERCFIHDAQGTVMSWGQSITDTWNVTMRDCLVTRAHEGDLCAGAGSNVLMDNVTCINCGDTCFPIWDDMHPATTNPHNLITQNITYLNCNAIGTYGYSAGGNGNPYGISGETRSQEGYGWGALPEEGGPSAAQDMNVKMIGCTAQYLASNVWSIQINGLLIDKCNFFAHYNTTTANCRFDNPQRLIIRDSLFQMPSSGTPGLAGYAAVMLTCDRLPSSVVGASLFQQSLSNVLIEGNTFYSAGQDSIQIYVGGYYSTYTPFTPSANDLTIQNNYHNAPYYALDIQVAGSTSAIVNRVNMVGNICTNGAGLVYAGAAPAQYSNMNLTRNRLVGTTPALTAGSGLYNLFQDIPTTWWPNLTGIAVVGTGGSFNGTISAAGVLTLTTAATGNFALNTLLAGTGINTPTYISTLLTGTLGAINSTYQLAAPYGTTIPTISTAEAMTSGAMVVNGSVQVSGKMASVQVFLTPVSTATIAATSATISNLPVQCAIAGSLGSVSNISTTAAIGNPIINSTTANLPNWGASNSLYSVSMMYPVA